MSSIMEMFLTIRLNEEKRALEEKKTVKLSELVVNTDLANSWYRKNNPTETQFHLEGYSPSSKYDKIPLDITHEFYNVFTNNKRSRDDDCDMVPNKMHIVENYFPQPRLCYTPKMTKKHKKKSIKETHMLSKKEGSTLASLNRHYRRNI